MLGWILSRIPMGSIDGNLLKCHKVRRVLRRFKNSYMLTRDNANRKNRK